MIKKTLLLSTLVLTMAGCATSAQGEDTTSTTNETKKETPVITLSDVEEAQQKWAENIIAIGEASLESDEKAEEKALETLENLYAYDDGQVLFKPTKAAEVPFRGTKDEALSYFVGGDIAEDSGFALEPWTDIRFDNHDTILNGDTAISSGVYYFTSGETNEEVKVEYTFGYIIDEDGDLKIQLHHSSVPFG
ncbi:hypothetical protein QJ527_12980 [Enterococcus mundtii]|uniref:lipoprotein n=1 Tax=Enterococcus TaxID=1350 RepID=UPI000449AEB0|nr:MULTISPECIES: lipoprotein [Enterococcus]AZP92750.1 hypothetical protein CYK55_06370 [Enterococcus mundtii]EYT94507.1 hypothetical protein AK89_13310 [Enterococcus mundtii CRL35]MDK4212443.1 hypothetical protein [Enterococcus mundtii]MEC3939990.1 hypothetical protein [Enterococcus mundtii]